MKKSTAKLLGLGLLVIALAGLSVYAEKHKEKGKQKKLPPAVKAALKAQYPKGEIEEVKVEEEGIELYEIEVEVGEDEFEVEITADGTIVEETKEIDVKDLPEEIRKALKGMDVEEASKEVTYWVVKLEKLKTPKVTYEVEVEKDGKEYEIEYAPDGTVLSKEEEGEDDDDDDDDDDNDD